MHEPKKPASPEHLGTPTNETEPKVAPARIYVASLADYNAGFLHGAWITADTNPDDVHTAIGNMLAVSPSARQWGERAEEWAIHDYEGFGPVQLSEYESIERVAALARGIARHGQTFAHWWNIFEPDSNDDIELDTDFNDHYLGTYDSIEDYGRQLLGDLGFEPDDLPGVPESLRRYVHLDVAAWVRDIQLGGEIHAETTSEGTHVFNCI